MFSFTLFCFIQFACFSISITSYSFIFSDLTIFITCPSLFAFLSIISPICYLKHLLFSFPLFSFHLFRLSFLFFQIFSFSLSYLFLSFSSISLFLSSHHDLSLYLPLFWLPYLFLSSHLLPHLLSSPLSPSDPIFLSILHFMHFSSPLIVFPPLLPLLSTSPLHSQDNAFLLTAI